jgi:tripartite-type tricarboxylate transporter receptor subunit TctC
MKKRTGAALLAAALALAGAAQAQDYPTRPIRLIVPFGAGGGADVIARIVGQKLGENLGQTIVVENRPGAGGNVGSDAAAKAVPDGYTLLVMTNGVAAINPSLYPKLTYDAERDFAPIALLTATQHVLAVGKSIEAKTVGDLIALAKKDPGKLTYASAGPGSTTHMAGELFASIAGIKLTHVPYRAAAQAMSDLASGRVDMVFDNLPSALPRIKAGTLRALALAAPKRSPALPDVPTMAEAGVQGYAADIITAIVAPAKTPKEILAKLTEQVNKTLKDPDVAAKLAAQGVEVLGGTAEDYARVMKAESEKWSRVVKEAGVKID